MTFRRFLLALALLLFLIAFVPQPQVMAQDFNNIDFQRDILWRLDPRPTFPAIMYDFLLYFIFILAFITLFLVPDKQFYVSILVIGVLLCAFIAKLEYLGANPRDTESGLLTFVLNVYMFVIPMIVAGLVRGKPGKPPRAIPPSIATGLFGGVHFFAFWLFSQSGIG